MLCECLLYIRSVKPDIPVCLVLDDLSVFVSVGVSLVEVVGLAHYCQRMITSLQEVSFWFIIIKTLHWNRTWLYLSDS